MANAIISPVVITIRDNQYVSAEVLLDNGRHTLVDIPHIFDAKETVKLSFAPIAQVIPTPEIKTGPATISPSWARDYLDRIHISPTSIDLGNILNTIERDIVVWNSYNAEKTLLSVEAFGNTGMTLQEPESAPTVFGPQEERVYRLTVTTEGDSAVNASFVFTFDTEILYVNITGERIVVWEFVPQVDFIEILEWKTDIIKAKSGEQRIAVRAFPRRIFNGNYFLDSLDFNRMRTQIKGFGHRQYGYPLWVEAKYIGSISSSTTTISFDTSSASYVLGGMLIIYDGIYDFETGIILNITSTSITLSVQLVNSFTEAYVMPLVFAHNTDGANFSRTKDLITKGAVSFTCTDDIDIGATSMITLRDHDVLMDRSVIVSDLSEKVIREVDVFDAVTGPLALSPKRSFAEYSQTVSFDLLNRDDLWVIKQWLFTLKGKQKGFFLPSWNRDLQPIGDIVSTANTLTVHNTGSFLYPENRDIIILDKDGTLSFNTIYSATKDINGNETIYLNSNIGRDIPLSSLDMICYVNFVRLDSDHVEINHRVSNSSSIIIPIIGIPEV